MAVQGLDTNGDGVFSKEELQPLAEVNVKSLKDFDYFTFVHIGDADNLPLKPPEDYSLDYDKSLITLHFTLPLETPLDPHGKVVTVDVYDPSFFVAFGFATESPVKLSGTPAKDCTAKIKRPDAEIGGGRQSPERSLFQPAWAEQQFRLAVCPDGGGEMRQRSFLARAVAPACRDSCSSRLGVAGPDGCRACARRSRSIPSPRQVPWRRVPRARPRRPSHLRPRRRYRPQGRSARCSVGSSTPSKACSASSPPASKASRPTMRSRAR